jgi:hypothetical protein
MSMRSITDFPRSEQGLVDNFIGTAYDNIMKVYEVLPELEALYDVAEMLPDLAEGYAQAAVDEAMIPVRAELAVAVEAANAHMLAAAQSAADAAASAALAASTATDVATTVATNVATTISNDLILEMQAELAMALGSRGIGHVGLNIEVGLDAIRTVGDKLDDARDMSDFAGFVGDGINDDSDAVEAAGIWQLEQRQQWNPEFGGIGTSAVTVLPAITVSKGARIKLTRKVTPPAFMKADGFASIEAPLNVDMFENMNNYRSFYENFYFIGGDIQVHLANENRNGGQWMFNLCSFVGSNKTAVKLDNTSVTYGVTSTIGIFKDCRWMKTRRGLSSACDHVYIQGGWMQPESDWFDTNTPFIEHWGMLTMTEIMLIPGGPEDSHFPAKARWVSSHGGCRFNSVRFGGEDGGLPAVYWHAVPPRFVAGTAESIEAGVTFNNCTGYFGGIVRPDRGGVVLQGQMPRNIRYIGDTGPITGLLVNNDPANGGIPDIPAYFAALKTAWGGDDMHMNFRFCYLGLGFKYLTAMWPAAMDTYSYTDRGRYVNTDCMLSDPSTIIAQNVETRLSFDTQVSDPYSMVFISGAATVIKTPLRAQSVSIMCNIKSVSVPANSARYTATVYYNNVATDIVAYYDHVKTGPIRLNLFGSMQVVPGMELDVRVTHEAVGSVNFTANLKAEFDVKDW